MPAALTNLLSILAGCLRIAYNWRMIVPNQFPTPYPDVNDLVREVLSRAQAVLGSHWVGMYLDGSLASGDFEQDSDIDFVMVTDVDVNGDLFAALQEMHDRIAQLDTCWAIQLEGSYISAQALRRFDPDHALHPNIERGSGERLKMVYHDEAWNVHRQVLRERGIIVSGPAPDTLVDPVSADDLRSAMQAQIHGWLVNILNHTDVLQSRGYQSYAVLTLCRMLYTIETGQVASKPKAARWAQEKLGQRWNALIERTWDGRHNPDQPSTPEDFNETLEFIRYTLQYTGSN